MNEIKVLSMLNKINIRLQSAIDDFYGPSNMDYEKVMVSSIVDIYDILKEVNPEWISILKRDIKK